MAEAIGPFCARYGQPAFIYYEYIAPIQFSIPSILMISLIVMYIKAYIKSTTKMSAFQFSTTIFYFMIQFICMIFAVPWSLSQCQSLKITSIFHIIGIMTYSTQTLLLLLLLFHRLYMTYYATPAFALSRFTIITFIICYTITCIVFISGGVLYSFNPNSWPAQIYALSSILSIILTIVLFAMYLHKLYIICKKTKDEDLIHIISKNSLLAVISIFVTILSFIAFSLIPLFDTVYYIIFVDLMIIMDVCTNALCIFLAYHRFNGLYLIICGICHNDCMKKCVESKDLKNMTSDVIVDHSTTV